MEESGVTKVISVRLENDESARTVMPSLDDPYVEEEVEVETGCELPVGIDDPSLVSEAELRPIRSRSTQTAQNMLPMEEPVMPAEQRAMSALD
jgi:chromosome segregation protein